MESEGHETKARRRAARREQEEEEEEEEEYIYVRLVSPLATC